MDHPVFAMMRYNKDNMIAVHSVITYDIPDTTHICGLLLCISYFGAGVGWVGQLCHQSALWKEGNTRPRCKLPCTTPRRESCCRLQLAITANYQHIGRELRAKGLA